MFYRQKRKHHGDGGGVSDSPASLPGCSEPSALVHQAGKVTGTGGGAIWDQGKDDMVVALQGRCDWDQVDSGSIVAA